MDDAARCVAYGPGLVEGVVGRNADFVVETPGRGKLEVKVEGPRDKAQAKITNNGDGTYAVTYVPSNPGEYLVHVTYDGKHIPGSIFHVRVLQDESLGGEGKIRVYYSTTTSSTWISRPMQEFLEQKKVHQRPDFEPWIPVDIMEPKDRDAVFRKAGTKNLPIVFIDDVYVGDHDTLQGLDKSGKLDQLLKFNEASNTESVYSQMKGLNIKVNTNTNTTTKVASSGGKFCSKCGATCDGGKFCPQCGGKV